MKAIISFVRVCCGVLFGVTSVLHLHGASMRALVLQLDNPISTHSRFEAALTRSGFEVDSLPLDVSATETGAQLIVLGSFANRNQQYADYMKRHASSLREFVAGGGVLLQLAQHHASQISEPFLPDGMRAARGDAQLDDVRAVQRAHPLLRGLQSSDSGQLNLPRHLGLAPSWHTFMEQEGCAVILGAGDGAHNPVFLEAAHGRGRFLMTSLFIDRFSSEPGAPGVEPRLAKFEDQFARNLSAYVQQVRDGRAPPVAVTPQPVPLPFVPGSWTLAVLPDTQYYARSHPHVFEAQTRWIAEHAAERDIRYVLHLGDITADNLEPQWELARQAMSRLDGIVPYALVGGNHDYGPKGNSENRESHLNRFFPVSQLTDWPTFGGAMEPGKIDNTFHCFEAGGEKWIVLALEFAPRDEVVRWADRVLSRHPRHRGILVTHAYMSSDNTRFHWGKHGRKQPASPHYYKLTHSPGSGNDGEELWQKLVRKHPQMLMTLNGHTLEDGVARLSSRGDHGNVVHQMLVNYQRMRPFGGNGFLRLYEFLPDGRTIQVRSYSPLWDRYKTDVQNQFILTYDPHASTNATFSPRQ